MSGEAPRAMSQFQPLEPIAAVRERTIDSLGRHFAQDHITLDELERRLERAYRATAPAELVELTHDLPAIDPASLPVAPQTPASPPARAEASGLRPGTQRMLCVMSNKKRQGYWEPPRQIDLAAIMSETVLDFTAARVHEVMDIHLTAVMANVQIIVPEGARVMETISAFMASVENDAPWDGEPYGGILVRMHGTAVMSEVRVRMAPRRGRAALPAR